MNAADRNAADRNAVDVNQVLRAAVVDVPPTGIDLDRLIGREQRRQRSVRTLGVVCAAAASVLMVVTVFGLSGRASTTGRGPVGAPAVPGATASRSSPRPCPSLATTGAPRPYQSGAPSPRPVPESCGDAAFRLDAALPRALRTHVPGVTFADRTGSGQPVRFLRANDENLRYDAGLSLTTSAGRGSASVGVEPRTYGPQNAAELSRGRGCDSSPSGGATCVYRAYPDGTVVNGAVFADPGGRSGIGKVQYQVQVFRTDSTVVAVRADNTYFEGSPDSTSVAKAGGKEPPLTVEQMIEIARDPSLTLYP
jgi:hypothetical protein